MWSNAGLLILQDANNCNIYINNSQQIDVSIVHLLTIIVATLQY